MRASIILTTAIAIGFLQSHHVTDDTLMNSLPMQLKFDSPLPNVVGNADYDHYCRELDLMDDLCHRSGLDDDIAEFVLEMNQRRYDAMRASKGLPPKSFSNKKNKRLRENAIMLFRAALLRKYESESLRPFCRNVAAHPARQWFCKINRFAEAKIFSKSQLNDFENALPADFLQQVQAKLLQAACGEIDLTTGRTPLGLEQPISIGPCYADTTCLQANIHHPVDWVLFRDATRTLMLAVALIRENGLRNRMPCEPAGFISQINKLCIQMAQCRRQKNSRKRRKQVLREMKRLLKKVEGHALRHVELLKKHRDKSNLTEMQAHLILDRTRRILEQLDTVVWQAHERIIGERRVPNHKKTLSLYEKDIQVIVRGKANAETEFGNTLLLVEQVDGLIVDSQLLQDKSPGDAALLLESMERLDLMLPEKVDSFATDRGFDSPAVRELLESKNIFNAVCPKSPAALIERLNEPEFRRHQKRRAQTEARIAILNHFMSNPMLQKGFEHREIHMRLSVLAHNIKKLARLRCAQEARSPTRIVA